jgi:hypothetical protein
VRDLLFHVAVKLGIRTVPVIVRLHAVRDAVLLDYSTVSILNIILNFRPLKSSYRSWAGYGDLIHHLGQELGPVELGHVVDSAIRQSVVGFPGRVVRTSSVQRGKSDEDLDILGILESYKLFNQVQALGRSISEHHDHTGVRHNLQDHLKAFSRALLQITAATEYDGIDASTEDVHVLSVSHELSVIRVTSRSAVVESDEGPPRNLEPLVTDGDGEAIGQGANSFGVVTHRTETCKVRTEE